VYFVQFTDLLAIDAVLQYLLFVCIGIQVARDYRRYVTWIDRYRAFFVLTFLSALGIAMAVSFMSGDLSATTGTPTAPKLVIGVLSIPALHALVRSVWAKSSVLLALGLYTFPIYLMNTLAIGVTRSVLQKLIPWDGFTFLAYAPLLVLSGVLLPVLLKRIVLPRVLVLDRITT
jgi:peptidoglycan/LPS O-acetylase OafA/YrhL